MKHEVKHCQVCSKPIKWFDTKQYRTVKYCDWSCRNRGMAKAVNNISKLCERCGSTYKKRYEMSWVAFSRRQYCSRKCQVRVPPPSHKGKPKSEGHRASISRANKIAYADPGRRRVLTLRWLNRPRLTQRGVNSNYWKGGITPINKAIRTSLEYKMWRRAVFERDDYTCVLCGERGVELNADHIKPFAYFPELRFELSNGRTLCVPCHKETDTYKAKATINYGNRTHH